MSSITRAEEATKTKQEHNISVGALIIPGGELVIVAGEYCEESHNICDTGRFVPSPGIYFSYEFRVAKYFSFGVSLEYLALLTEYGKWNEETNKTEEDVYLMGNSLIIPVFARLLIPFLKDRLQLYFTLSSGLSLLWYNEPETNDFESFNVGWFVFDVNGGLRYWFLENWAIFTDGGYRWVAPGRALWMFTPRINLGITARF